MFEDLGSSCQEKRKKSLLSFLARQQRHSRCLPVTDLAGLGFELPHTHFACFSLATSNVDLVDLGSPNSSKALGLPPC